MKKAVAIAGLMSVISMTPAVAQAVDPCDALARLSSYQHCSKWDEVSDRDQRIMNAAGGVVTSLATAGVTNTLAATAVAGIQAGVPEVSTLTGQMVHESFQYRVAYTTAVVEGQNAMIDRAVSYIKNVYNNVRTVQSIYNSYTSRNTWWGQVFGR